MDLLQDLIRARALDDVLARTAPEGVDPDRVTRAVSPAVPAARALRGATDGSGDVFSLRRGSPAAALVLGADPREILRQRLAKATAPGSGRDPGGFPTDLDRGLLGPVELPGTLVEVMSGVALGLRLRGEPRVALLVDDLAGSGSGDWHEGLNFAAVREVPMVLVVDPGDRGSGGADPPPPLADRAPAYGFRHHDVSGSDPREVEAVVRTAVEAARGGEGLQVVEVAPPPQDPVAWLLGTVVDAGEVDRLEVDAVLRAAAAEMEDALRDVLVEPEPRPDPLPKFAHPAPNPAH